MSCLNSPTRRHRAGRCPFRVRRVVVTHESNPRRRQGRRGVSLAESVAAVALLTAVAATLMPLIARTSEVRTEAVYHATALAEAGNVMERIAILREDGDLSAAEIESFEVSAWASRELPQPELTVTLNTDDSGAAHARLVVALSWINSSGRRSAPVVVTSFVYGDL